MAEMWDYWLYSMNAPFGRTRVPSPTNLKMCDRSKPNLIPPTPPAVLKVHTAAYHFLGNGKIRRFGCSLLFSGVASVTHVGYRRL